MIFMVSLNYENLNKCVHIVYFINRTTGKRPFCKYLKPRTFLLFICIKLNIMKKLYCFFRFINWKHKIKQGLVKTRFRVVLKN